MTTETTTLVGRKIRLTGAEWEGEPWIPLQGQEYVITSDPQNGEHVNIGALPGDPMIDFPPLAEWEVFYNTENPDYADWGGELVEESE